MRRILTSAFFLVCLHLNAQHVHEECGTDMRHKTLMQTDPAYRAAFEDGQKEKKTMLRSSTARTQAGTYKIPVVVHVLHLGSAVGTAENISDEQIYSAIDYMNKAYAHEAPYNQGTLNINTGIEFCLVQKDPNGNATTGINRVNMSGNATYVAGGMTDAEELNIKNATRWDRTKYYNIWIVSEINNNGGDAGVQGYAYLAWATGPSGVYDGAVILYNAFGYDPDGIYGFNLKYYTNMNVTATHEIGHALGLYHTFEGDGGGSSCPDNGDCTIDGDEICDTPPHIRSPSNCQSGTNSCTSGSKDLYIHNFMEYSSDVCQYEFTAEQAQRMRDVLDVYRTTLVSGTNLTNCGCDGSMPIVRFSTDNPGPCPGQTVTFTDYSLNFPSTWNWTFPGGTPSSSTAQNPTVTYATAGTYNVTLTVNSGQTGTTVTKTAYIKAQGITGYTLPITENFTSATYPPAGFTINNPDNAPYTWERVKTDGGSNYAARVNNYVYDADGEIDEIMPPYIDLTGYTTANLTFRVAHKNHNATYKDTLKVIVTTNCDGSGGTVVYDKCGTILQTTSTASTAFFVPASSADWRTEVVNLDAYVGQKIRIVFRNITRYGNNTYIDDINIIENVTGALSYLDDASLGVYPNPANNQLHLEADAEKFDKVEIVNMRGEMVLQLSVSEDEAMVDISSLSPGVYMARFSGDSYFGSRRFVIVR